MKYGLLRAIANGATFGVAWYLLPDEAHNDDGRHIAYLNDPYRWRSRDPELFDGLSHIVAADQRRVSAIEISGLLPGAKYASEPLMFDGASAEAKQQWRRAWFWRVLARLSGCDIVFADPDNGLCENERFRPGRTKDWKRLPLSEAMDLAAGRTGIFYHHNTRRKGGHWREIKYWSERLGNNTIALRWRAYSSRTFFVVNPTPAVAERIEAFEKAWSPQASLHGWDR